MGDSLAKILIVDDALDFCESLAWLLNDEGYQCRVANHGEQAIQMLAEETADLILLDWEMPILNGAGFLQRRETADHMRAIPVLVLSASTNIEANAARFNARFLQKPLDFARLLATMKALLEEESQAGS